MVKFPAMTVFATSIPLYFLSKELNLKEILRREVKMSITEGKNVQLFGRKF